VTGVSLDSVINGPKTRCRALSNTLASVNPTAQQRLGGDTSQVEGEVWLPW